jgi:hypothetical protein
MISATNNGSDNGNSDWVVVCSVIATLFSEHNFLRLSWVTSSCMCLENHQLHFQGDYLWTSQFHGIREVANYVRVVTPIYHVGW